MHSSELQRVWNLDGSPFSGETLLAKWVEACGIKADPADFWRNSSKIGKQFSSDPIAIRMLTNVALLEESPEKVLFVAILLNRLGRHGLAARLVPTAEQAKTKKWQRAALEVSTHEYEEAKRPACGRSTSLVLSVEDNQVSVVGVRGITTDVLLEQTSWQECLVAFARESGPMPSAATTVVEMRDDVPLSVLHDLAEVAYLAGLRVAVVAQNLDFESGLEDVDQWLALRGATLPLFVRQGEALRPARLLGGGADLGFNEMPALTMEQVTRWLEFGWLFDFATAPLFHEPKTFELRGLVNSLTRSQYSDADIVPFECVVESIPDPERRGVALERLATVFLDRGDFGMAVELFNLVPEPDRSAYFSSRRNRAKFGLAQFEDVVPWGDNGVVRNRDRNLIAEASAAMQLLDALERAESTSQGEAGSSVGNELHVCSILHASPPYQSGGYANRAHQLLSAVQDSGINLAAFTRPGFPDESLVAGQSVVDEFEGVKYVRLGGDRRRNDGEYQYMLESLDAYREHLRIERPDVVHLRSTYVSALPGMIAAKELGIPTVYEVSGMWELVYATYGDARRESMRARTVRLEDAVLQRADRIVTLTAAMADIINGRVSTKNPVEVLPNAVDTDRFVPSPKDAGLLNELGWDESLPVIGYAGSVVDYEGLEVLVDALALLRDRGVDFRFVLIGDGAVHAQVRARIEKRDLEEKSLVTGRIPHAEVERYYSIFDICAFPRLSTPATEAVSPLKPFEALSSGKAVVVSDVAALAEIIGGDDRGLIVPSGDVEALAEALQRYVDSPELRDAVGSVSRDWVIQNHTWEAVGGKFVATLRAAAGDASTQS